MKLRLPNKLQAALMAALASISFTTLSSGTLSAAFFFGSQAFAEEAADNPGATIDIGDTNLDPQAAIDEEEGKGEAKEPGSAPINQAGFNGIYGSSDDADRAVATEVIAESSIDTENVGTAGQANYTGTSADLPSNDLGFTSNPYASGSDTSNGSDVDSPVTSSTQAPQIASAGGYSAAGTGSGSNSASPVSVFGNTGSGATGGGSFGSGISLGSVTKAAPTPVILGAAGRNLTPVTTLGDANAAFANATWTFENSLSADTTISNPNLSYEWKGGGSATYVDSNMNKGTKVGNYWLDADLGKAITFEDGQYIKVGTNAYWTTGAGNLNTGNNEHNSYTVMAWVKLDATAGEQEFFGTGDGVQNGMGFGLNGGKADILTKWLAHNNFDALTVTAGKWVNVALTYDMESNKGSAYINGDLVGSMTIGNSNMPGGECSYIGASAANAARDNFAGQIAELSILSGALTQQEILAAAHLTSTSPEPKEGTFHVYILTGQSNSLGAVKGTPLPSGLLSVYEAEGVLMYNANITSYASKDSITNAEANPQWVQLAPQKPEYSGTGWRSLCMGPEYGFAYVMQQHPEWYLNAGESEGALGVVLASLDGGGNQYWDKSNTDKNYTYNNILQNVKNALTAAAQQGYGKVSLDGLMYLQGESNKNGGDPSHADALYQAFINNLKSDLDAWLATTDLDIKVTFDQNNVAGEPATWTANGIEGSTEGGTVTAEKLLGIATKDDQINADENGIGFVYTRDLAKITLGDNMNVHYRGTAQLTIGARYAYAFAVQNGIDVGTVRGQDDAATLDSAAAWWKEVLPTSNDVAVWDISSVTNSIPVPDCNHIDNSLTVGGIRIEEVYAPNATTTGEGSVAITGGTLNIGNASLESGSGITLVGGDLSISSTINAVANQTWSTGDHQLTTSGTVNIQNGATLTIAGDSEWQFNVVQGNGSLVVTNGATLSMTQADLNNHSTGGSSYSDGNNGFLSSGYDLITLTGDNSSITINPTQITWDGALAGKDITLSADSKKLQILNGESTVYHVRDGVVVYNTATGITDAASIDINDMGSTGATLELGTGLASGVTITSSGNGGAVKIDNGVVLGQGSLGTLGADVKLTGSGRFDVTTPNSGALPDHVSLDQNNWTGTVRLANISGGAGYDLKLNSLGTANSTVEFENVTAYLNTASETYTYTPNIKLTGKGLDIDAGSSSKTYTFNGSVSGDGTLKLSLTRGSSGEVYVFAGDVENWNGEILAPTDGKAVTLKFTGDADTVNAKITRTGGTLNLQVANNATFGANVTGINNLTTFVGTRVAFNGATTTINGSSSIDESSSIGGTITNGGAMTLAGKVSVTGSLVSDYDVFKPATAEHYSGSGTYDGSGFLTTDAQYYLVKGGDGSTLNADEMTFKDSTIIKITAGVPTNSLVFQQSGQGTTYYINKDLTYDNTEMVDAVKISVTGDNTLTLSGPDAATLGSALKKAVGAGNVTVAATTTVANGTTTLATGNLTVSNAQLNLGGAEGNSIDISSFSKLVLDNGVIKQQMAASTYNNVTVDATKTGKIASIDMNTGTHTLAGDTMVAGTLTLANWWNAQFKIENLVGNGTLEIRGTIGNNSVEIGTTPQQNMALTIDSLSSGSEQFTGHIDIDHKAQSNKTDERYAIHSGNQAVSFASLRANVLSEATVTYTAEAASTIGRVNIVTDNSTLTVNGDATTTITSLTGAGNLKKEGSGTLVISATNSYTSDVSVNSGKLELTSAVSTGNMTVATGATLAFAGVDMLTLSGTLTLESGSRLDLARIFASPVQSAPLFSAVGGEIVAPANGNTYILATANSIGSLDGVELANIAQGYTGTLSTQDAGGSKQLILTLASTGNDLIWDNHAATGKWNTADSNWHVGTASAGSSQFKTSDDVKFTADTSGQTVTMDGAITAGSMTVAEGATVTIATSTGNTLNAAEGITVENGATMTLQGTGVTGELSGAGVVVGNAISSAKDWHKADVLGSGVTYGNDWTGTVKLTGTSTLKNIALNDFGQSGSKVELSGVTGYFQKSGNDHIAPEVVLSGAGLSINDGYSTYSQGVDTKYYFDGGVSGEGNMSFGKSGNTVTQHLFFTGDVEDWEGGLNVTGGFNVYANFSGDADTVNASINRTGGNLYVEVDKVTDPDSDAVTFNKAVSATKLEVKDGASATFKEALNLSGNLTMDGTDAAPSSVVLEKGGRVNEIDLSNNNNAHGTVTVKAGQTLTYGNNFWGSNNNRLILEEGATVQKASGAPITIAGLADNGTVSSRSNSALALNNDNFTLDNVKATINTDSDNVQLLFTNSQLVTGQNVTLKNTDNTLTSTTVSGNTLTVAAGMDLGAVDVQSGATLALTSSTPVTIGSGTIAGTLKLGMAEQFEVDSGVFAFASGSTLNLTALNISTTDTVTLGTANGGSFSADNLGSVTLNLGQAAPTGGRLEVQGTNLVLTFTPIDNSLIWDAHTDNIWTNNGAGNWHVAGAEDGSSVFAANDDVIFKDGTHTVSLGESVTAGTMTVAAGENLTITDNSHNISATSVSIGGTLNANSGALNASTPVTIAENGKWVVSDMIPTADSAKAMNVTVQEGAELHIKGASGEINGAWVDLPDASGAGKVVLDSGTISYLSDLGGNTLVLSSGTVLRFGHAQGTNKHEYSGDIELAGDATISVWGTSQHSGVLVSGDIIGNNHKLSRWGGNNPITFTGNVSLGEFTVTKSEGANPTTFSGSNTVIGKLNSNQQTEFTGNATVNTLSSSGNLVKSGADTTLTLGGTDNYTGAVTVNSGTLALTDSMTLGAVTVTNAGILQLAGNDEMLTTTGAFTLASGSTLDLSNYTFSGTETVTLVTTSGSGSIVAPGDWSSVNLVFNGEAPENAALSVENNNLVLTFAPSADLIWDNNTSDSSWTSSHNWHEAEAELGSSVFKNGDSVSFTSATPNAAPTLGADVTADTMSIATGETVTVEGAHVLTVTSLAGAGANLVMNGSSLTVTDGGSSTVGKVTEHGGTMNVANTGTAKGSALFTGDIQVDGGSTLNLTPAGHDTTIAATQGAQINGQVIIGPGEGTAEIKVTNQSSVTLTEGLHFAENAADAKFTITGDRNQYVNGLYGSDVTLNIERTSESGAPSRAGYFVVNNISKDEFSGTINLHTIPGNSGRQNGGMIVYNSPEGLANTVVNFGTRDSDSALAFLEDRSKGNWDGDYQDGWSRSLQGGTFQNALLGGLDGTKGKVWANDLTINTAADVSTTFGGVLAINSLTKAGDGTQTLSAANSYTGGTVVSGGSLVAANANALGTGTVMVDAGATLEFASSLTSAAQTGAITLASGSEGSAGGTLTFGGVDANALNVTGALTLRSGSVLDVSNLNFTDETGKVILAKTTGGITPTDLSSVKIEGQGGYGYTLSLDGNNLVLDYESSIKTLIWRRASSNVWMNESREEGTNKNWYTANNPGKNIPFSDYDRVRFATNATVQLGSDIVSGRMIVDSNSSVTIETNDHALAIDHIEGSGGSLTVKGTDVQTQTTDIQGNTTLKNLTLDDGTVSLGGHTEVSGKVTVKNDANVTANATLATNALDISSGSEVNLAAGGTALTTKVAGGSSLSVAADSSLGKLTLDDSTLTNNANLGLSNTADTVVKGASTITGTGITTTTGFNLTDGSSTVIDGGQTISITSSAGIFSGSSDDTTLTLRNATLTGTSSWTLDASVDTVTLAATSGSTTFNTNGHAVTVETSLGGAGNLTKDGLGTLTLGSENSYTGSTTVSGGTLKVNNAAGLACSTGITVGNGGTLWFNSVDTASLSGTAVIQNGGTLFLGRENALEIEDSGSLTLSNGSTLALYGLAITKDQTKYVLASGAAIDLQDGFGISNVAVEYGTHAKNGSTPSITVRDKQGGGKELVLTYQVNDPDTLYWNGGNNVNWTAENVWHDQETKDNTTFARYDDVYFDTREYTDTSTRAVQVNVVQNTDVHTMHIAAAEGGLHTVTALVNSGQTLNVDFLEADDNTKFIKNGAGVANIGIDDKKFGADIELLNGTLNANIISMNGDAMKIGSDVTRTNGNLNLVVGREDKATNAEFTGNVSGLASMTVQEGSNATFSGTVTVPNGVNTVFTVGNDASLTFKHDVNLNALSWVMQGDGDINMQGTTTISQAKTGYFNSVLGNVSVYFKELATASGQVSMRMDQSASVKIGTLTLSNDGQETIYFCTQYTGGAKVDRATVEIDKVVVSGNRGLGSNISKESGMEYYQQGSTIVIRNVDNADGTREGGDILRLCNYAAYFSLKQHGMAPGWEVAMVFRVGDSTASREAAFDGVFRLQDSSDTGNWYGTEDKHKQTVMVVEDEFVASNSVIEIKNYCDYSDFGVGIGTNYAQVVGIRDYEGANQKFGVNGNKALLFSGEMSDATDAKIGSDDTLRTLELIGKTGDTASTVYSTSAGVDRNLNIVKDGAGTQVFSGDSSKFDGSIDAKDGLLKFLNTASLTVQDLTLAANGSATDGTLAVRSDAAGTNVGMAEVHGTLKAKSGAALASNLTLAADSVLDVRDTLSAKTNPEMTDKTDYVGGLDMLGNSLTLHSGAYLSNADRSTLLSMQWGERYELAYGLSSLTLGDTPYSKIEYEMGSDANIEASQYFANLQEDDYYICYSGANGVGPDGKNVGVFYIFKAPEPTTSTLSLLALAALAARRRRK